MLRGERAEVHAEAKETSREQKAVGALCDQDVVRNKGLCVERTEQDCGPGRWAPIRVAPDTGFGRLSVTASIFIHSELGVVHMVGAK